uniref:p77 homologue n=1 Tax=Mamestra brassicae TaxID=55057 RepID=E0D3H3_MAMBR|nr:p77 homologue [Mamestra brassicae]
MLPVLYLVFLCSNFLLIRSEDDGNVTIKVNRIGTCKINRERFTFTEGQKVNLIVQPENMFINYGWWTVNASIELYDQLKSSYTQDPNSQQKKDNTTILYTKSVDWTMGGTWEFKFYHHINNVDFKESGLPVVHYNGSDYLKSLCRTTVTIESAPVSRNGTETKYVIIASVVFVILVIIILAQAAYIVFLKAQAQKLITHNNLSKKSEPISNDRARYCSNPGQKMMKEPIPVEDDNRDSVIYEAPNIEISSKGRMPIQPPQPPAINTMPRAPRSDHNLRIGPTGMLASALNSPARSPVTDILPPNFQRLQHIERENSVANRPPQPLPPQNHPHNAMFQEVYEEAYTDENTYEPPPVINTMPPRLPMPPKKVPTGNLLDVKENTLKHRQGINKPPVTPKPHPHHAHTMTSEIEQALRKRNNVERESTFPRGPSPGHMMQPQHQEQNPRRRPTGGAPTNELEEVLRRRNNVDAQTNELEEALRRRNNVVQVPIVSIPDPSSRSSAKPRPGPPPVQKSRPPPVRHPVQEEIYYNEASSDEDEWTYEPLKPLNSYDQNIYNV